MLFERSNELTLGNKRLEIEKHKKIMLKAFPINTIDDISKPGNVMPKNFSHAGLLLAYLVGFTRISSAFETQVLFKESNEICMVLMRSKRQKSKPTSSYYLVCRWVIPSHFSASHPMLINCSQRSK